MSRTEVAPPVAPQASAGPQGRLPTAMVAAVGIGAAAWVANAADRLSGSASGNPDRTLVALLAVDALVGAAALGVLTLRRRRPIAVACATTALIVVSAASLGPAMVAIFSVATLRRRTATAAVALVSLATLLVDEIWPLVPPTSAPGTVADRAGGVLVGLLVLAIPVAAGFYTGARRELITSLEDRARTAEREQVLVGEAAREAERTRIAREMHDVLAHRISLVALHAGALAYREDLTRAETASTAATIQANAQLALVELRQVLGVLRGNGTGADEDAVEEPQPTLAELPALLADAREAGTDVRLESELDLGSAAAGRAVLATADFAPLGATLSRTAFRIVQEGLTNARKHAPGQPVEVRLRGAAGGELEVEVRNRLAPGDGAAVSSAGVGLLGLRERAELAGGSLQHGTQPDASFTLRARLPWPA